MKNALPITLTALLLLAATACKKQDDVTPTPTDPNAEPAAVPVLRDGAGFTQPISKLVNVSPGVTGLPGDLGVYDFSLDRTNQLHLMHWTGYQSQQDYLKSTKRSIYNLNTKAAVNVPTPDPMLNGAYYQGFTATVLEFLPYTGNVVAFNTTGLRSGFASQAFWAGSIPQTALPMAPATFGYTGGAGFYNVYTDFGTGKHYMTVNPNPASTTPLMYLNLEYKTPAQQGPYLADFPEPRFGSQGQQVCITVSANAVEAYKFPNAAPYTRTGQLTPSGYTNQAYTTQRHYSPDGTRMAMLVRGETDKNCWTYTYNFTTDVLAANLSNVDLPYSAAGSDIDLDEDGNVYYTGVAGNGTKNGVSVYKRTASGTAVVGTDDFLKFGEVVKLHYYNGKVHMAVQGKVTGRETWSQICFLSQN